jgi:hypothetical protein
MSVILYVVQPVGPHAVTPSPPDSSPSTSPVLILTLVLVAVAVIVAVRRRTTKHWVLAGAVLVSAAITVAFTRAHESPASPAAVAPVETVLGSPCDGIQLDPKDGAKVSIERAGYDTNRFNCEIVLTAKREIGTLGLHWVFYDAEGIKLGDDHSTVQDLQVGEKQKVLVFIKTGTATIVSKND